MTQVDLRNINLSRNGTTILRDVNLTIEAGEFCVFVGPSGCGKSTLLRLIAGLDEDAEGEITIDGVPVGRVPAAKRNVAMVFQGYALYPHMTVYENMAFALRRSKVPKLELEERVKTAARILKLDELLHRKPNALSGGQCQRVAIGRAIVKKPKVFLFDEPLSNLDAGLRVETRVEIAKLHRELGSASMLYVTHDQAEALTLADKIVLLAPVSSFPGRCSIVQTGRPMELYHNPASLFAAAFIGNPGMNLLVATVHSLSMHGVELALQDHRLFAEVDPTGLAVGELVTIGIRPEHVVCAEGGLRVLVTHIESLGEHAVLYTKLDGYEAPLLVKSSDEQIRVGDLLPIDLPGHALHLFRMDGLAQRRLR